MQNISHPGVVFTIAMVLPCQSVHFNQPKLYVVLRAPTNSQVWGMIHTGVRRHNFSTKEPIQRDKPSPSVWSWCDCPSDCLLFFCYIVECYKNYVQKDICNSAVLQGEGSGKGSMSGKEGHLSLGWYPNLWSPLRKAATQLGSDCCH